MDIDDRDVQIISSKENKKLFRFASLYAHVIIFCPMLDVVRSIMEPAVVMQFVYFVYVTTSSTTLMSSRPYVCV